MKTYYTLILCGLLSATNLFAGIKYTSPATGYVTVGSLAEWNAIAWTSSSTVGPNEYILQPGFTIKIGPNGNHNIDLTASDVIMTVYGRIGFYNGNNTISMTLTSQISVMLGGMVGFADANGSWYGDAGDRFYFGTNPADFVKGPFYVFGPDVISLANPPESSYLWTGNTSTEWTTGGNWITKNGNPAYPSSAYNAVIPTSPTGVRYPHITTTANSIKGLAIQPGATVTIEATGVLTIFDSLHNFGIVTVKSGGALVQGETSYDCDYCPGGTFNIERQTGPTSPWFIGSPINTLSKAGYSGCGNGQYSTTNCTAPSEVGGTSPCIMSLNEDATANANCAHNLWFYESSGIFINGKGYCVYGTPGVLNFSGNGVNNGYISNGPLGYSTKGNVIGPNGSSTRGWHIVSNPYPSPIQISGAQLTAMGFNAQIQRWNSATGNWVSSNPLGTLTLAVGQAFEIRVNGGPGNSGTFALDNSFRVGTIGSVFYKTEDLPQQQYVNITLSNGNLAEDNTTMVYFQEGATLGFDGAYDANRLFGLPNLPYVYTVEQNGEFLSYNAFPLLNPGSTQSVPLNIHDGGVRNLTLTFEGIGTINADVMMEDLKTGMMYRITDSYVHSFVTQAGDSPNRFMIHFNKIVSGISDERNNKIIVFPNPTSGRTTLLLGENHGYNELIVSDLEGRVISSSVIAEDENSKSFDFSDLASGVYTIKLIGVNGNTLKMVRK